MSTPLVLVQSIGFTVHYEGKIVKSMSHFLLFSSFKCDVRNRIKAVILCTLLKRMIGKATVENT